MKVFLQDSENDNKVTEESLCENYGQYRRSNQMVKSSEYETLKSRRRRYTFTVRKLENVVNLY